jgi:hypothetical protein
MGGLSLRGYIAKRPRLGRLVKKLQITSDRNWDRGPTELTIDQTDSHAKSNAGRIERKDDRQLVTLYRE